MINSISFNYLVNKLYTDEVEGFKIIIVLTSKLNSCPAYSIKVAPLCDYISSPNKLSAYLIQLVSVG